MKKIFSTIDLSAARFILSNTHLLHQKDQFGSTIFTNADLKWAADVVAFFDNLYNIARNAMLSLKKWCISLKYAYNKIKQDIEHLDCKEELKREKHYSRFSNIIKNEIEKYKVLITCPSSIREHLHFKRQLSILESLDIFKTYNTIYHD